MKNPLPGLLAAFLIFISCIFPITSEADDKNINPQNSELYVPQDLAPWVKWIQQKNPDWDCAYNASTYICVWPGHFNYKLLDKGAEFALEVQVLAESSVQLPALAGNYPRNIKITNSDGKAVSAPFEMSEAELKVRLPAGHYTISGTFIWDKAPTELPLPGSYATVEIQSDGNSQKFTKVRGSNYLRLEEHEKTGMSDSLSLNVMRKITDGSPLTIETLIRLQVAGRSRPVEIPNILPGNSEPISMQSYLPARLNQQGSLVLQLLPGAYDVRIVSVMQQPANEISCPSVAFSSWPKEEIWTWWTDLQLRTVEFSGGQPVDSQVTQLPAEWKGSAAYVIKPNDKITLTDKRRGQEMTLPDQVSLNRQIWLDLDGKGATIHDSISGSLYQKNRINAADSIQIGRASSNGQPALITIDPATQAKGLEVRSDNLNFEVISRANNSDTIPASGWDQTISSYSLLLNIPPAWRLLHVGGAVHAEKSWVDTWSLLRIFLGVLLALSIYKLFGIGTAAVLTVCLILNHNEFLAPNMLFVHIAAIAALSRIFKGFSETWYKVSRSLLYVTFGLLVIQILSFAKLQLVEAIFPQLQSGTRYRTIIQELLLGIEDNLLVWPMALLIIAYIAYAAMKVFAAKSASAVIGRLIVSAIGFVFLSSVITGLIGISSFSSGNRSSYYAGVDSVMESYQMEDGVAPGGMIKGRNYAPQAVSKMVLEDKSEQFSFSSKSSVSGPALPEWRWKTSYIQLATPLDSSHLLKFYMLPPFLSRLICALRAVLIIALSVLLFSRLGLRLPSTTSKATPATAVSMLLCALLFCSQAKAEIPDNEMLKELEARLASARCTAQSCTSIDTININIRGSELKITASTSSSGKSFVTLPGPLDRFDLKNVSVNSKITNLLRRNNNGFLEVQTSDGQNAIELTSELPAVENFNLQFQQKALAVTIDSPEWFVEGIDDKGLVRDNLRFIRQSKDQAKTAVANSRTDLPVWIKVSRSFRLSDQFNTSILVERLGNFEREARVSFNLLKNEKLISQLATIDKDSVELNFDPGQKSIRLNSVLPFSSSIELIASNEKRIVEEWQLQCDTFLACTFSGIKPVSTSLDGQKVYTFLPFPAEKINVDAINLNSPKGDFYTVDKVIHNVRWGTNILEGQLTISLRATQQSSFWLKLPDGATLSDVSINGQSGQSTSVDQKVAFVLNPGDHNLVTTYNLPWQAGMKESAPAIELASPSSNVNTIIQPSGDRWLLWLGGQGWGPAVVFWTKLLVLVLICFALHHFALLPGSKAGIFLLGIGLATLPVWTVSIPLLWLIAIHTLPRLQGKLGFCPRWLGLGAFGGLMAASLVLWFLVVQYGLLFSPPMLVAGNSSNQSILKWYVDHSGTILPSSYVISVPVWYYRLFALLWSSWLAVTLFKWLKHSIELFRLPLFGKT